MNTHPVNKPTALPLWLWPLLAGGVPLAVYLLTMPRTVFGLDSAELSSGAYTLGIVHAPGAPLYLMMAHLFTLLNVGDVGYRVNLFSVVSGAGMLGLVWSIVYQLTGRRGISLGATWLLGFSYYLWAVSLVAELYAPAAFFFAASLAFMLRWNLKGDVRALAGSGLIFGLGLGVHISLILLLPGMLWLAFARKAAGKKMLPELLSRPGWILITALLGIAGSLVYLYLPVRYLANPALDYARDYWGINLATWEGFWWMVTGRMFGSLFFGVAAKELPAELGGVLYRMWSNFFGLGVILAGLGWVWGRSKVAGWRPALGLMAAGYLIFYVPYRVSDKELMFAPVYLVLAAAAGIGLVRLTDWVEKRWPAYRAIPLALILLLNANLLGVNYNHLDLSRDVSARQLGEQNFAHLDQGALFFGTWRDIPVMEYLQLVEGQRRDVRLRNLIFLSVETREKELEMAQKKGMPVYSSVSDWFSRNDYGAVSVDGCDCIRISPK